MQTTNPLDSTRPTWLRAAATPRRLWLLGIITLVLLACAAVVLTTVTLPSADELADRVRGAGALGPVVLFGLLVLQCVVAPLPSEPLMLAAGFVYGPLAGFALAWLGVVLGAVISFVLARRLGRPFVRLFVRADKLDELELYVGDRGLGRAVAILVGVRLFAFNSFDPVSYGCGLISFPFRWFFFDTALGAMPKAFAFTYLGSSGAAMPVWVGGLIVAGTFSTLLVVPWLAWRRRRSIAADRLG